MGLNAYFAYGVCITRDIPVGVADALAIMCGDRILDRAHNNCRERLG